MANSAQARKRARQAENNRQRNAGVRTRMRTFLKRTVAAVAAGDKEAAVAAFNEMVPVLDRTVSKGVIHKNKAARHKSRLAQQIKALG